MALKQPPPPPEFKAYVSEPITRCPPREKGRIRTLIDKIRASLLQPPYSTGLYVPSEVTSPEARGHITPEHIYLIDRIRVVEADYMLVIADHTSFGIGGEVEIATALGKPVVIISRERTVSRFLTGSPANAVRALERQGYYLHYRDWRDLKPRLLPIIEGILSEPATRAQLDVPFWDVGKQLRKIRAKQGISLQQLAAKTGLRVPHLRFLEKSLSEIRQELAIYQDEDHMEFGPINLIPYQLEQLTNIGLPVLHKLAVALEVPVSTLMGDLTESPLPKGPGREAKNKIHRIEDARNESLKARAAQYDVTFREYEQLQKALVTRFIADLSKHNTKPARKHEMIHEREFLDALGEVRGALSF